MTTSSPEPHKAGRFFAFAETFSSLSLSSLELSDTNVYKHYIRAHLATVAHFMRLPGMAVVAFSVYVCLSPPI